LERVGSASELTEESRAATEVTGDAVCMILILSEEPTKEPEKEGDVDLFCLYLIKLHNLFEHILVAFSTFPDGRSLQYWISFCSRPFIELCAYFLNR
jgi:hypothetical protein